MHCLIYPKEKKKKKNLILNWKNSERGKIASFFKCVSLEKHIRTDPPKAGETLAVKQTELGH